MNCKAFILLDVQLSAYYFQVCLIFWMFLDLCEKKYRKVKVRRSTYGKQRDLDHEETVINSISKYIDCKRDRFGKRSSC
ncbi:hypothetical protein, partial [Paenibacillus amylolyticus]|uniref:hypothetical protein n=1 Tax=Paenibacillus amylolyticus TaxID=1451 RepID=UPI00201E1C64